MLAILLFRPKAAGQEVVIEYGSQHLLPIYIVEQDPIKSLIISKANDYHISAELFLEIVRCESGFDPSAKNPESTASGLLQFIDSTFYSMTAQYGLPSEDKNDPTVQATLAAAMIADGGIGHWNESKDCWGKSLQ